MSCIQLYSCPLIYDHLILSNLLTSCVQFTVVNNNVVYTVIENEMSCIQLYSCPLIYDHLILSNLLTSCVQFTVVNNNVRPPYFSVILVVKVALKSVVLFTILSMYILSSY